MVAVPLHFATLAVEGKEGEKIVGDSRAGEMVGETALFAREMMRAASVVAAEDSRCLVVDRSLLRSAGATPALAALARPLLGSDVGNSLWGQNFVA